MVFVLQGRRGAEMWPRGFKVLGCPGPAGLFPEIGGLDPPRGRRDPQALGPLFLGPLFGWPENSGPLFEASLRFQMAHLFAFWVLLGLAACLSRGPFGEIRSPAPCFSEGQFWQDPALGTSIFGFLTKNHAEWCRPCSKWSEFGEFGKTRSD